MSTSKSTVGLVELADVKLVIDHDDYLTITQSADLQYSDSDDLIVGHINHADTILPAYQLSRSLQPIKNQDQLQQYRFCLGFKCRDESDNFALLCNNFTQVDLSSVEYNETKIPEFMKGGLMPVSKILVYAGETYLQTSSELLLNYINSVANVVEAA